MMNRIDKPFNFSTLIALFAVVYVAYYLLLNDNFLHSSISSIISHANHLAIKKHLLVLGLLPIYIATMIFGAALLGVYIGTRLESLINRATKNSCLEKN